MASLFFYRAFCLITALLCVCVAVYGWTRSNKAGRGFFVGLMFAGAIWAGAASVESMVLSRAQKIFFSQVEYIGLAPLSVFLLLFAVDYTQQKQLLSRLARVLLYIIPLLSLALVWTNGWHHLHWSSFSQGTMDKSVLVYHRGPVFWFIMGYTYVFSAIAYAVLATACRTSSAEIRRQYLFFMLSGLFPLATGAVYLIGQDWVRGVDVSPLGFCVAGLIIAWNLFQFKLLDLVPVGRAVLIEQMPDGMIVIDEKGRPVDSNPMARRMLGMEQSPENVQLFQEKYPDAAFLFSAQEERQADIVVRKDELEINVRMVPLFGKKGKLHGRLFILRDITESVVAARERDRMIKKLERAVTEIKDLSNLLPICCSCKKIRNDDGYWQQLESYMSEHARVEFSHGFCPECEKKLVSGGHPSPPAP